MSYLRPDNMIGSFNKKESEMYETIKSELVKAEKWCLANQKKLKDSVVGMKMSNAIREARGLPCDMNSNLNYLRRSFSLEQIVTEEMLIPNEKSLTNLVAEVQRKKSS